MHWYRCSAEIQIQIQVLILIYHASLFNIQHHANIIIIIIICMAVPCIRLYTTHTPATKKFVFVLVCTRYSAVFAPSKYLHHDNITCCINFGEIIDRNLINVSSWYLVPFTCTSVCLHFTPKLSEQWRQKKTRQRNDRIHQEDKKRQHKATQGNTRHTHKTTQDQTRQDYIRRDKTILKRRQDTTRQDKATQNKTKQGKTRQARQAKTRQDTTRQGKTTLQVKRRETRQSQTHA